MPRFEVDIRRSETEVWEIDAKDAVTALAVIKGISGGETRPTNGIIYGPKQWTVKELDCG